MLVAILLNCPSVLRGVYPAIVTPIKILRQFVNRDDFDPISDSSFDGLLVLFKYVHAIIALDFQHIREIKCRDDIAFSMLAHN